MIRFRSHLTPEELLEAAESRRAFAHLDSCIDCRRQVVELRNAIAAVTDADTPEPSPLFWEHFSDRVGAAVRAERIAPPSWWAFMSMFPRRTAAAAAAFAAVVLVTAISLRSPGPGSGPQVPGTSATPSVATNIGGAAEAKVEQEAALQLIADLSSDLDWDAATEAGLTPRAGWVDGVLNELTGDERAALEKLLQEEISRSGA